MATWITGYDLGRSHGIPPFQLIDFLKAGVRARNRLGWSVVDRPKDDIGQAVAIALKQTTIPFTSPSATDLLEALAFSYSLDDLVSKGLLPGQENASALKDIPTETKSSGQPKRRQKVTQKEAAASCNVSERTIQLWDAGTRTPDGYPGRSDVFAFKVWAEKYKQRTDLEERALNMNRATSVDPKIIEERHSFSAFEQQTDDEDNRGLEELIEEQAHEMGYDKNHRMRR